MKIESRQQAIELIDKHGKRREFVCERLRTPEEYFEEYSYLEPDIWTNVLIDFEIIT